MKNTFTEAVKRFHNDEDGALPLETVVLIGVALVVVVAIWAFWDKLSVWFNKKVDPALKE